MAIPQFLFDWLVLPIAVTIDYVVGIVLGFVPLAANCHVVLGD
jgi:hypothetical protein